MTHRREKKNCQNLSLNIWMAPSLRLRNTFKPTIIEAVVNFINIYACLFCTIFWRQSQNVTRKSCPKRRWYEKSAWKTLMKLTPVSLSIKIESEENTTTWLRSISQFRLPKGLLHFHFIFEGHTHRQNKQNLFKDEKLIWKVDALVNWQRLSLQKWT